MVWTNTATGELDDVQLTDAAGLAQLHLEPGGAVSAAYSPAQQVVASWEVHSILAAQPGDELVFGGPPSCDASPRGAATVSFEVDPGASSYQIATACGPQVLTASPYQWSLAASDPNPADVTLLAIAAGGDLVASAFRPNTPLSDGAAVSFIAADWMQAISFGIGVSGVPADLPNGYIEAGFAVGASNTAAWNAFRSAAISNGVLAADIFGPPLTSQITTRFRALAPGFSSGLEFEPAAGPAAVHPLPTPPTRISSPQFDPELRSITWTTGTPGVVGDRVEAQLYLQTLAGEGLSWSVWAPPTSLQLTLPLVPTMIPDLDPATSSYPSVLLIDYADQAGWDDSRSMPQWDSPSVGLGHPFIATIALPPTA